MPLPPVLSVQPSRSNGGYIIAAIAGVVIAGALAGGGFMAWRAMRSSGTSAPTASIAATTTTSTTAPAALPPASAANSAAAASASSSASSSASAASSDVEFQVMPDTAYLVIDGVQQPASLRVIPRPAHGSELKVIVRAPGYGDESVVIDDAAASPVLVILTANAFSAPTAQGGVPGGPGAGLLPTASAPAAGGSGASGGIVLPPNPYRQPH